MIQQTNIDGYINHMEKEKYSTNYKRNLLYYAQELVGSELNETTIDAWILKHNNNLYRAFLRSFLHYLKINIEITNPKGRTGKRIVKYYTVDEINKIVDNVDDKLKVICLLMFEDGLRISEVMNLQKNSFDLVNKMVNGNGKGDEEFSMPLSPGLCIEIEKWVSKFDNEDLVFHWPKIKHQRQKAYTEIKKNVMNILPYKKKSDIGCHIFRDSCGTYLQEHMTLREIQDWLRHKQLETTARYTAVIHGKQLGKWENAMQKYRPEV